MKAKDLIGKKVTRIAPAKCRYGEDRSYMGDILIIVNADDEIIMYTYEKGIFKGETHTLSSEWCDDNWKCLEEFLNIAETNMTKIKSVLEIKNEMIDFDKELDEITSEMVHTTE